MITWIGCFNVPGYWISLLCSVSGLAGVHGSGGVRVGLVQVSSAAVCFPWLRGCFSRCLTALESYGPGFSTLSSHITGLLQLQNFTQWQCFSYGVKPPFPFIFNSFSPNVAPPWC